MRGGVTRRMKDYEERRGNEDGLRGKVMRRGGG